MNNKIKLNFNYALVIFSTTMIFSLKRNFYFNREFVQIQDKYYHLRCERNIAFIPIISLKKNR